jgi:flavin-dependent dehydrogenase
LLGDAAGFLDPITGGGMAQALMTAELLATYVGRRGLREDWLGSFERDRQKMLWGYTLLTRAMLWLAHHPRWTQAVLSRLRLPPGLLSHFVAVAGGVRRLWGSQELELEFRQPPPEIICAIRATLRS